MSDRTANLPDYHKGLKPTPSQGACSSSGGRQACALDPPDMPDMPHSKRKGKGKEKGKVPEGKGKAVKKPTLEELMEKYQGMMAAALVSKGQAGTLESDSFDTWYFKRFPEEDPVHKPAEKRTGPYVVQYRVEKVARLRRLLLRG